MRQTLFWLSSSQKRYRKAHRHLLYSGHFTVISLLPFAPLSFYSFFLEISLQYVRFWWGKYSPLPAKIWRRERHRYSYGLWPRYRRFSWPLDQIAFVSDQMTIIRRFVTFKKKIPNLFKISKMSSIYVI